MIDYPEINILDINISDEILIPHQISTYVTDTLLLEQCFR